MTRHRFFLPADRVQGETVHFSPDQSRQIRGVLRLRPGDSVIVLTGDGTECVVALREMDRDVTGTITRRRANPAEPALPVTLYQALLKGSKIDLILQKGTEVGLAGFVPVMTARAVAGEPGAAKQRRYDAIVREAAEQSERGRIPGVGPAVDLDAALRRARGTIILPYEDENARRLMEVPLGEDGVSLFIGPEGGWTEEEVGRARAAGAEIVTLGRRILRAETAAIVAAALILARMGELG